MKNYKQILEAVNRGILLALDDFDDEETPILNIKSKLINHRDYTKEYLDLMKEVVDLGLPSGTLWCKYNLGVNPNQLTRPEDWYGGYYAWGELEGNKTNENGEIYFDWTNYKFGKNGNNLTKYCNNPKNGLNGFTDNLTELQHEDDVAYLNKKFYNFKFHIPTKELFEELKNYTKNYLVKNYDPNKIKHNPENDNGIQGLNGYIFEGKSGNEIFFPYGGLYESSKLSNVGSKGYYWSSNLNQGPSFFAYCLYFSKMVFVHYEYRYNGFTIRPVINL